MDIVRWLASNDGTVDSGPVVVGDATADAPR
jgi:hypothetical protein